MVNLTLLSETSQVASVNSIILSEYDVKYYYLVL